MLVESVAECCMYKTLNMSTKPKERLANLFCRAIQTTYSFVSPFFETEIFMPCLCKQPTHIQQPKSLAGTLLVAGVVIADYQETRVRDKRSRIVLNIQKANSELTIRGKMLLFIS